MPTFAPVVRSLPFEEEDGEEAVVGVEAAAKVLRDVFSPLEDDREDAEEVVAGRVLILVDVSAARDVVFASS